MDSDSALTELNENTEQPKKKQRVAMTSKANRKQVSTRNGRNKSKSH